MLERMEVVEVLMLERMELSGGGDGILKAQKMRLGALNATQQKSALYLVLFLRNKEKPLKLSEKWTFYKYGNFCWFFLIFSEKVFCKGMIIFA